MRKRHMSYIRFVKRLGFRDAVSRRFFVIFQYEAPTNERNIAYAEIVSTLETTARNFVPIWRSAAMPSWNTKMRTSSSPTFSIPY